MEWQVLRVLKSWDSSRLADGCKKHCTKKQCFFSGRTSSVDMKDFHWNWIISQKFGELWRRSYKLYSFIPYHNGKIAKWTEGKREQTKQIFACLKLTIEHYKRFEICLYIFTCNNVWTKVAHWIKWLVVMSFTNTKLFLLNCFFDRNWWTSC